jgi:enterochelin esterase family protein
MTHSLLVRAEAGGTPIIAGDTATFVWQGAAPPVLVSDLSGWDRDHPAAWTEVAPALWSHTMTLTPDAYIEYAYLTGAARDERTPDPFNSRAPAGM